MHLTNWLIHFCSCAGWFLFTTVLVLTEKDRIHCNNMIK